MSDDNGVPPDQVTVRSGTAEDAATAAELHEAAINEGFLATLGPRFLRRLYARIAKSPHGFLLVAVEDAQGPVIGFVAGATSVRRLYGDFLLRDGIAAGIGSAPRLLRSVPRVLETLRYGAKEDGRVSSATNAHDQGTETELLSLAVASSARRRGAGRLLIEAFQREAARRGAITVRVVVGATNSTAIRAYENSGFEEAERFEMHEGSESLLLRADLSSCLP